MYSFTQMNMIQAPMTHLRYQKKKGKTQPIIRNRISSTTDIPSPTQHQWLVN